MGPPLPDGLAVRDSAYVTSGRAAYTHAPTRAAIPWAAMTDALNPDVDPDRARELIEAGEVQLVDVREPYEWEAGHIAGARHIEIAQLTSEAESLDRERPVLFYCRVGSRSGMAAAAFRQAGFDAYSVDGGLVEWDRRGHPLEPADGTVADH
jgi:rhodanese-related sulfurtransferase